MFTDLIRRYGKQELYEQYTRCVDEKIKEKIQWIADGSSVLAAYILLTRDSSCLSYTAVTISNRSTRKNFFFSLQSFSPFFIWLLQRDPNYRFINYQGRPANARFLFLHSLMFSSNPLNPLLVLAVGHLGIHPVLSSRCLMAAGSFCLEFEGVDGWLSGRSHSNTTRRICPLGGSLSFFRFADAVISVRAVGYFGHQKA